MRILYVAPGYKPAYKIGGPIHSVSACAETLVKKGHEVVVYATNSNLTEDLDVPTNQPLDVDGVQVWYFERQEFIKRWLGFLPYLSKSAGFFYSPAMRNEMRRSLPGFDLVHTQMPFIYPTYAASLAAARHHKPLFYSQRGSYEPSHLQWKALKKRVYIAAIERKIMERSATLIALTESEVADYQALGLQAPCRVVPNGIDVSKYGTQSDGSTDSRFGLAKGALVILFLGRLHPIKGADALLEAFCRIHDRHPNAVLVMAGPDEHGLEAGFLETAQQRGVAQKVLFVGTVTGEVKTDLLARADLFCLPSHAEGFSMAVLEALASSTAVLLSPGCKFPEVEGAGAGRVVPNDPDSLANGLTAMLAQPEALQTTGQAGREFVARDYTWDRITDRLLEVYQEGIDAYARGRGNGETIHAR